MRDCNRQTRSDAVHLRVRRRSVVRGRLQTTTATRCAGRSWRRARIRQALCGVKGYTLNSSCKMRFGWLARTAYFLRRLLTLPKKSTTEDTKFHRGSCTEDNESQNRYCISLWQFSLCFPVFSVVSLLNLPMSPTKKNCVDLRFLFGLYFLEVEGGCLDLTSVERGRLPHGAQRSGTRVSDPHGRCRIRGNRESAKN